MDMNKRDNMQDWSIKYHMQGLLEAILDNYGKLPTEMEQTPERYVKACHEWFSGYERPEAQLEKHFEAVFESDGLDQYKGLVVVGGIQFYSHCEHHTAPFFGTIDVAYIPNEKVIGLSKVARITEVFTRRFQTQERITDQIADAFMEKLDPRGIMVICRATHLCMCSRGAKQFGAVTTTSSIRGAFNEAAVRAEALQLIALENRQ